MTESVAAWWSRRRWSKSVEVPYPIGSFRDDWERYPVLIRQYHPDLNDGVSLTQIPPAADVYLQWQCDAGHVFVATPLEQRNRPGRARRRSSWCPQCLVQAVGRPMPSRANGIQGVSPPRTAVPRGAKQSRSLLGFAGEAFYSERAPKPASAAEARLRQLLGERLDVDLVPNAVRVKTPFFDRYEVWPDIVLNELRVVIEYDTTGREGLEHVGKKEASDRRKDRALRAVDWEVVRIRCGKLQPIGSWDITAAGVSASLVDAVIERLGEIRGELIVRAYLRATAETQR
jgi:very-short-patch-repair endonuclease